MLTESEPPAGDRVTAVLVSHDGERWLPDTLAALAAQVRPPDRVIAVDTGSQDSSPGLLSGAFGTAALVQAPRGTGLGDAVRLALQLVEPAAFDERTDWVWILHDDCAPAPRALAALLDERSRNPTASVLGPKVVDWDEPKTLREVGLSVDARGFARSGLEPGERDQGQRDGCRAVLAVGTAGMLVRRSTWEHLGGLAPELALYGDDVDFGWRATAAGETVLVVPAAVVRHAAALDQGMRAPSAAGPHPARVRRRHAHFVRLANCGRWELPGVLLAALALAVLTAAGLAAQRRWSAARDEVAALLGLLVRPGMLRSARRRRAAGVRVPARALRPLFLTRRDRVRLALAHRAERGRHPTSHATSPLALPPPAERGPVPAGRAPHAVAPSGRSARGALSTLVAGLALVSLIVHRAALTGPPSTRSLFPALGGSSGLWAAYVGLWHPGPLGVGVTGIAPAWQPLLAVLSTVLFGKPWLAVQLLLLAAMPLAGLGAALVARRVTTSRGLQIAAGGAYALQPAALAAVRGAHVGALVALIGVPPVLSLGAALLTAVPRSHRGRLIATAGLAGAAVAAFTPEVGVAFAVLAVLAAASVLLRATPATHAEARRTALSVLAPVLLAAALLEPWSVSLFAHPGRWLGGFGPGAPPSGSALGPAHLLLVHPPGSAGGPLWVAAPVLLVAFWGLTRVPRRPFAGSAWTVALVGLGVALAAARVSGGGWPGDALVVAGAGVIGAATVAADGAVHRLSHRAFGLAQLGAGIALLGCAVAGVAALAAGLAGGVLSTGGTPVIAALPAFVSSALELHPRARVLVLAPPGPAHAGVRYTLASAGHPSLADEGLRTPGAAAQHLAALVADVLVPAGTDAAAGLATFGVRYVVAARPLPPALSAAVDSQDGLARIVVPTGQQLWRDTVSPAGRALLLAPAVARAATAPRSTDATTGRGPDAGTGIAPQALSFGPSGGQAVLPPGPPGRLVVLASSAGPGWYATAGGRRLVALTAWGWAQAFQVPAAGGRLVVGVDASGRHLELFGELLLCLLALLGAAPARAGHDRWGGPPAGRHDLVRKTGDPGPALAAP